jgi:gamma-glutamyltranspeptidase/glutathione hydrolase
MISIYPRGNRKHFSPTCIGIIALAATVIACAQRSPSEAGSRNASAAADGESSRSTAAAPVALDSGDTFYPVVRGRRGAVVGGNSFTAQAGFRLLVAGGNAIDAGVAMVLAAAVTEFDSYGFGGEVPILIYLAERDEVVLINGVGFAPEASRADLFDAKEGIPGVGPLAAVVPSVLDNSLLALKEYGTRSFCEVSAPALELAQGFPMIDWLSAAIEEESETLRQWPASARAFLPDGRAPEPGEWFAQADLAATLQSLCEAEKAAAKTGREGALQAVRDHFYRGPIGKAFVRGAREVGGILSQEDLAAFEARVETPLAADFEDYEVFKAGYWTQGPVFLHVLGLLSHFDLSMLWHNTAEYIHIVTEAMKLAFADRDVYFGDPDFAEVPDEGFLSRSYMRARVKLIERQRASSERRPGNPWEHETPPSASSSHRDRSGSELPRYGVRTSSPHDTTNAEAADADGNLFSATASGAWLPSVIAGTTGIPMSQRMESFVLEPGHPNVLAPRKRPRITLTPTIVLRDGRPWMALSTVGGDYQEQVMLQVFLNIAVFGMNAQQAVEAPKFTTDHLVNSFAGHAFEVGALNLEQRLFDTPGLVIDLEARGHAVASTGSWQNGTAPTVILYDAASGIMEAGADPRYHRQAIAW